MKILISFAKEFEHYPVQKDVSAHETVENLEIMISLSIPEFNTYDLYYKNQKLGRKQARLGDVLDPNDPNIEINVVKKGAGFLFFNQARNIKQSLLGNANVDLANNETLRKLAPVAVVIVLVILFFMILG